MPYQPRHFKKPLQALLKQFPVVCILGPRQCGKTTFVRHALSQWRYVDLEKPSAQIPLLEDPEATLERWKSRVILDEAQQIPQLFPILRSQVDERRDRPGQFILLGSASWHLIQGISESLAGRVGFLDMTPFHCLEVDAFPSLWLQGGFPNVFLQKKPERRRLWMEAYTRTFIEQDLNRLGIRVSAIQMRRLWQMLAHQHGSLWNASQLASALGTSYHTVNHYVDILEQTFLVRKLPPYHANIKKRLVKSPKVYIRDTGLLHFFLGINSREQLLGHPQRGYSWEGFVIEQIVNFLNLYDPGSSCFFWQTSRREEVDLLIEKSGKLIPIEIKTHHTPGRSDLKGLFACMQDLQLDSGFVVRPQGEAYSLGKGVQVVTLAEMIQKL